MIDLNNEMSFVVSEIAHVYYPRKLVSIHVQLVPTPGGTAPDPDSIDKYGINFGIAYGMDSPGERTKVAALLGRGVSVIRQFILDEWAKYQTDPATADPQLWAIFEYVTNVGVKP